MRIILWYIFLILLFFKGGEVRMEIAICDDEQIWFEELKLILDRLNFPKNTIVQFYFTGEELIAAVKAGKIFDLIILDIYFSGEAVGLAISKEIYKINSEIPLCFLTTSAEFVFDGYDVQAIYYLLKPITVEQFLKVLKRIEVRTKSEYCIVSSNYETHKIYIKDILYIESSKRQLIIHSKNKPELTIYFKLKEFSDKYLTSDFLQCHQSYIVNMEHIDEISSNQIILLGEQGILPISRKFKKIVMKTFKNFMFKEN